MVEKLLDLGINYIKLDVEGMTAYDIATLHEFYEVAVVLNTHHEKMIKNKNVTENE